LDAGAVSRNTLRKRVYKIEDVFVATLKGAENQEAREAGRFPNKHTLMAKHPENL